MPALNFRAEFVHDIEEGIKRQTIRLVRKRPTRQIGVGSILHLFTGMRTKACRRLSNSPVYCNEVSDVYISDTFGVKVDHEVLDARAREAFAHADGFESWPKMREFFERQYGLPFRGVVIKWEPY